MKHIAWVLFLCIGIAAISSTAHSQTAKQELPDLQDRFHFYDSIETILSRPCAISARITLDPELIRQEEERYNAAHALVLKGKEAHAEQKYAMAVSYFKQALVIDKRTGPAWEGLADVYASQGKIQDAIATYRKLYGPHPNWSYSSSDTPFYRMKFVLLLLRIHAWDEALASYQEAYRSLSPVHVDNLPPLDNDFQSAVWEPTRLSIMAHLAMAYGYFLRDHNDAGLPEVAKALRIAPRNPLANYYYGYMLLDIDQRHEAAPYYHTASQYGSGYIKVKSAQTYRQLTETIITPSR